MHGPRPFVAKVTLALTLGLAGSFLASVAAQVAFAAPAPTFGQGLEAVLESYAFGLDPAWMPWAYLGLLAFGLLGVLGRQRWGYVLALALFGLAALLAFNPFAIVSAYVLVRLWPVFFSHEPDAQLLAPEWRQLLTVGFLTASFFSVALFRWSPVQLLEGLRPTPVPAAPTPVLAADDRLVARAATTLTVIRSMSAALVSERAALAIASYPVAPEVVDLRTIERGFPSYVQELLDAVPVTATVGYWSNGTSFAFFTDLPVVFHHPQSLAVTPLPGMVLVRTEGDVVDDLDFDGLTDDDETARGTSPVLADTDGDGTSDGAEIGLGTNPRIPNPR
ncbi:MAG: hypothetical protein HYZ09_02785 [Candidatus Kerfeldbacteria bacterium]|nr:hypothetical protein [Candidatus Kerfeldbacteria bacterium]